MQVYPFTAAHTTSYLVVENDEAMLIDAASLDIVPQVLSTLQKLGARLNLIVLTHFHYDHVEGVDAIRKATGAKVAIHRLDAAALRAGGTVTLHPTGLTGRMILATVPKGPKAPVVPDVELGDSEDLGVYGGFGRTVATPGHTPGSQSVVLPDGSVFVGDALTQTIPARHAAGPIFADDEAESRRSITRILDASAGDIYIAHGSTLSRAQVQKLADKHQLVAQ
jgi:glyoxylase-like metal-dependent hydrolase (beta-lactamase superfamily II)